MLCSFASVLCVCRFFVSVPACVCVSCVLVGVVTAARCGAVSGEWPTRDHQQTVKEKEKGSDEERKETYTDTHNAYQLDTHRRA